MAYIPSKPLLAEDPLAYFAALTPAAARAPRPMQVVPAARALELMYGYYSAE